MNIAYFHIRLETFGINDHENNKLEFGKMSVCQESSRFIMQNWELYVQLEEWFSHSLKHASNRFVQFFRRFAHDLQDFICLFIKIKNLLLTFEFWMEWKKYF